MMIGGSREYCTYTDSRYLSRVLALHQSMLRHIGPVRLWTLCFDKLSFEVLKKLRAPGIMPISLSDFEADDPELKRAKENRDTIEYYFTCTPTLPLYLLNKHTEIEVITYLDADLFFFSDPLPLFQELGRQSVLIVEHRFPARLRDRERYGRYNVGLLSFRRSDAALQCLGWWRERCLEWCYDRVEGDRFADQKYLDSWPTRFKGVVVAEHKGAGLAPWNVENYRLQAEGSGIFVDSEPLLFFHFHGLKRAGRLLHDPNLSDYGVRPDIVLKRKIYGRYIKELHSMERLVRRDIVDLPSGSIRGRNLGISVPRWTSRIGNYIRRLSTNLRRVANNELWVVLGGRLV